jgi:hypothetical protein
LSGSPRESPRLTDRVDRRSSTKAAKKRIAKGVAGLSIVVVVEQPKGVVPKARVGRVWTRLRL